MKTNGNNTSSPNKRFSANCKSVLQRSIYAKGLRQRRSSQVFPLVFRNDTQTAHEIRNGSHTREFYIRFGLLSESPEPK